MNATTLQLAAGAAMLVVAILVVFAFRRYLAAGSERRMRSMLASAGLDPDIAAGGEIETIMGEVRERCRHCSAEDRCERWLKDRQSGDGRFCPNHRVFEILGKYSAARN